MFVLSYYSITNNILFIGKLFNFLAVLTDQPGFEVLPGSINTVEAGRSGGSVGNLETF